MASSGAPAARMSAERSSGSRWTIQRVVIERLFCSCAIRCWARLRAHESDLSSASAMPTDPVVQEVLQAGEIALKSPLAPEARSRRLRAAVQRPSPIWEKDCPSPRSLLRRCLSVRVDGPGGL